MLKRAAGRAQAGDGPAADTAIEAGGDEARTHPR